MARSLGLQFAGVLALGGLVTLVALADNAPRPQTPSRGERQSEASADRILASCLAFQNEVEITLSDWMQQKTQNEEVRKFAAQLVQDHRKFLDSLRPYAGFEPNESLLGATPNTSERTRQPRGPEQPRDTRTGAETAQAERPATPNDRAAAPREGTQREGQPIDFISLDRELAEQCLQSAQKELAQKEGSELDMCYLGMQIAAHQHALDAMKVFSRHVSPKLRETIEGGIPTVEHHLQMAKDLIKAQDRERATTNPSQPQQGE